MEETYFVPFQEAEAEYVEKRSRFIGHVWRVDSEEEARARIEQIRKKQAELAKQKEGSKGYQQAMADLEALQAAHQEYSEQL